MSAVLCECVSWEREINLKYLTNHHPHCRHYNDSLMDVWKVSDGTTSFYTDNEQDAAAESGVEDGYPAVITKEKMHREVFEHLPEFDGF